MIVRWLRTAQRERTKQLEWHAERNPDAAERMARRIEESTDRLIDFPNLGRHGEAPGTRVLVITRTPFVVTYTVTDVVTILHLFHTSQNWANRH